MPVQKNIFVGVINTFNRYFLHQSREKKIKLGRQMRRNCSFRVKINIFKSHSVIFTLPVSSYQLRLSGLVILNLWKKHTKICTNRSGTFQRLFFCIRVVNSIQINWIEFPWRNSFHYHFVWNRIKGGLVSTATFSKSICNRFIRIDTYLPWFAYKVTIFHRRLVEKYLVLALSLVYRLFGLCISTDHR